ncbi:MAG TPA: hypothetical protein ENN73_03165, partial [Firmicutes bacterium]|nr:hypothetical protein [Bacillota bacterium]
MTKFLKFTILITLPLLLIPGCKKPSPKIDVDLKPLLKMAEYEEGEENTEIFSAMEEELNRSLSSLKIDGDAPKLYFLSYLIEDAYNYTNRYSIGSKTDEYETKRRGVFVSARVGDYTYDNFVHPSERDFYDAEISKFDNITSGLILPFEDDKKAIKHALWLLTDVNYKKAIIEYTKKKSRTKTEVQVEEDKDLGDFSIEEVRSAIYKIYPPSVDKVYWNNYLASGAEELRDYPYLLSANIIFNYDHITRYFIDSEGRKIQFYNHTYSIIVN